MMVADVDDNTAKATTGFGGPKTPNPDQPECQWPKRLMRELVRMRLLTRLGEPRHATFGD
jgi:hypothetical protein